MTEVERAEKIARGPRRRFLQNIVLVVALLLGLVALVLVVHDLSQRAKTAETSAVDLAQQVQEACATEGSLDVAGRDLCQKADDVAKDPALTPAPVNGRDGVDGTDGRDGIDGTDGVDGQDGRAGQDGKPGRPGKDGVDGADSTTPGPAGADGSDGADGAAGKDGAASTVPGPPGRGIAKIECNQDSGFWIVTYTDSETAYTVPGPCKGARGDKGDSGSTGAQGTALPGTYNCPDGQYLTGFTVAAGGKVTPRCAYPNTLGNAD